MKKLNLHYERAALDHSTTKTGIISPVPSAAVHPSTGQPDNRPHGHRVDQSHQEDGYGVVTALVQPPVKGTFQSTPQLPHPHTLNSHHPMGSSSRSLGFSSGGAASGKLPKLNFPLIDGTHPKLWISRVVDYFELCDVPPSTWIRVAAMHFNDSAARWIRSVEPKLKFCSWSTFCTMIHDRFGKDQHELLIRKMFHIRQTSSVVEYTDQFAELVDQLTAYGTGTDPMYFTLRFIDGLKDDTQSAVMIQRPSRWDSAAVLARLQEEITEPSKRWDFKRPDPYIQHKYNYKHPLPLPSPPEKTERSVALSDDRKLPEASKARSPADSWAALRAYRRAQGLCQRCPEKWSRDHRCAASVQLHVLQEND